MPLLPEGLVDPSLAQVTVFLHPLLLDSKAPTQPQEEDPKRNLAAFDPNVEGHTLLPNLPWGSGSSGNLIKLIIRWPVGYSPNLGQIAGGMDLRMCSSRKSYRVWGLRPGF